VLLNVLAVREPTGGEQHGEGRACHPDEDSAVPTPRPGHGDRSHRGGPPRQILEALDRGVHEQRGARGRHGLVNESIDGAVADEWGELGFRFAITRRDDDEIGKFTLDSSHEARRSVVEGLYVDHQDTHAPHHQ
jgi:hypothetical protein